MSKFVLDETLKGIRGVRRDNQKVTRAPGPRTQYFERLFYYLIKYNSQISQKKTKVVYFT